MDIDENTTIEEIRAFLAEESFTDNIAEFLLEHQQHHSREIQELRDVNGETLLHFLVLDNNLDGARKALEMGIDVNAQNGDDMTALMNAIHEGNVEMVKLLLEYGSDIDEINGMEGTALEMARNYAELAVDGMDVGNSSDIVELLENGLQNVGRRSSKVNVSYTNYFKPERSYIDINKTVVDENSQQKRHIGEYILASRENIVIKYEENNYFFTTRAFINQTMSSAILYPCLNENPSSVVKDVVFFKLTELGMEYSIPCIVDALLNNVDLQLFVILPLELSYEYYILKRALGQSNACYSIGDTRTAFMDIALPSFASGEKSGGKKRKFTVRKRKPRKQK